MNKISKQDFELGDKVEVILNHRNKTFHKGKIRQVIWHNKDNCWNYYLEENGKKIQKRYLSEDLKKN